MTNRTRSLEMLIACASLTMVIVLGATSHATDSSTQVVAVVLSHSITAADINPSTVDCASRQATLTAVEYDKWLRDFRTRNLIDTIEMRLFKAYAEEHKLTPSKDDVTAVTDMTRTSREEGNRIALQQVRESTNFTDKQKSDILVAYTTMPSDSADGSHHKFATTLIENWKVQRALHQTYGGRLRLSSFGTHVAVDATVRFLRAEAGRGAFQIHNVGDRNAFWEYVANVHGGDGVVTDEEATRILDSPPWGLPATTNNTHLNKK